MTWDVCIIGAGPVGLVAASSALEGGARVMLVEAGPEGGTAGNGSIAQITPNATATEERAEKILASANQSSHAATAENKTCSAIIASKE